MSIRMLPAPSPYHFNVVNKLLLLLQLIIQQHSTEKKTMSPGLYNEGEMTYHNMVSWKPETKFIAIYEIRNQMQHCLFKTRRLACIHTVPKHTHTLYLTQTYNVPKHAHTYACTLHVMFTTGRQKTLQVLIGS